MPEFRTPSVLLSKCIFNVSETSVIYFYPLCLLRHRRIYIYIYTCVCVVCVWVCVCVVRVWCVCVCEGMCVVCV